MIRALLSGACLFASIASTACYELEPLDATLLVPDSQGWHSRTSNAFGVQGHWFGYSDHGDPPSSCSEAGMHPPERCSSLTSLELPYNTLGFANQGGRMCVTGRVTAVLGCCRGARLSDKMEQGECAGEARLPCKDDLDYAGMWGAGIALDFNLSTRGAPKVRHVEDRKPWNATAGDTPVVGVAFDLQWTRNKPRLRVEFPMQLADAERLPVDQPGTVLLDGSVLLASGVTIPPGAAALPDESLEPDERTSLAAGSSTEEYPGGSPYWPSEPHYRADWSVSPISAGHNEIRWTDIVVPPGANYSFTPKRLYGLQFHVVPEDDATELQTFEFCVSNLRFLLE